MPRQTTLVFWSIPLAFAAMVAVAMTVAGADHEHAAAGIALALLGAATLAPRLLRGRTR